MSERETLAIKSIYTYLQQHGVKRYRPFTQQFSKADGIFQSGETDCVFEFKQRVNADIFQYQNDTSFLEKDKYEALTTIAKLIDGVALYVVEYNQCVLIYNLSCMVIPDWFTKDLPCSTTGTNNETRQKWISELSFYEADFIIGKKDGVYSRGSAEQLKTYIKLKRDDLNNFIQNLMKT